MHGECRHIREILFRDNETGGGESRGAIEEHLASCPECAREVEQFRMLRTVLGDYSRPQLSPEAWSRWDERLERALDAVDGEAVRGAVRFRFAEAIRRFRVPLFATAAAAVVLLAIFGGKLVIPAFQETAQRVEARRNGAEPPTLAEETRQYLDRSQLVLLGMTHTEPSLPGQERPDIARMKRMAGELLREAPDLKRKLAGCRSYRLCALLVEMEVVLLQIANFDERNSVVELELVQEGVKRKGLLFKIDLETLAAEAESGAPSPGPLTLEGSRAL
jgi:hypothetical protein